MVALTAVFALLATQSASAAVQKPPADFNGDAKTDISVYRPSTGVWFSQGGATTAYGTAGDIPVPGDYNGAGGTDIAVYRPATGVWFVLGGTPATTLWGATGDIPVPGDYDGNGTTDIAVLRPSTGSWFVQGSAPVVWAANGDIAVPGDYDGNGSTDIAVYRPSTGTWFVRGGVTQVWGVPGDIPVPGDYDRNGSTDIAVYRPSTGAWFVLGLSGYEVGPTGAVPAPGDYDGSGTTDRATYDPATGLWTVVEVGGASTTFGTSGDVPLPLPAAIRMAPLNAPPALANLEAAPVAYAENDPATATTAALTVADADSANLVGATVTITAGYVNGQDTLSLPAPPAGITPSFNATTGVLTLSGTQPPAAYQTALRGVRYTNSSDNPSTAARTVSFQVDDGAVIYRLSTPVTRTLAVTAVNDAPTGVVAASHAVTGNVRIQPGAPGLLTGVSDPEGNTLVPQVDATNASAGNIVINADGSYAYNPKAGSNAADTVKFKVCDNGVPVQCSPVNNINLTITGMIWFVDNNAVAAGDGRLTTPFNTLAGFQAVNNGTGDNPAANDNIFVDRNVATDYVGPVTLLAGQKLFGKGATAGLVTLAGVTLAPDSDALPATGGTAPRIVTTAAATSAVNLATNNTIRGLSFGNTTGSAISGTGFGTLTATETAIGPSRSGQALNLTTGTLAATFSDLSSTSSTNAIQLTAVNGSLTATAGALSGASGAEVLVNAGTADISYPGAITNTSGQSVNISSKTAGTVTFSGAINDTGTGIALATNTGATFNFTGGIVASTGTSPAFAATGGGTVSVTGAANTLTTTTGVALNVANTTIGGTGLTFRSISAGTGAAGPASGIILNNTGANGGLTVTGAGSAASGGTIQDTSGPGISLTSTRSPSFAWMSIDDTGSSGVRGGATGIQGNITNFSFTNGSISDSGLALGVDDSSIGLNTTGAGTEQNVTGVVTITNNTLTNAYYQGVDVFNYNGTISDANISNNTITSSTSTATSKGSGIRLIAFGGPSTAASVTKATINNNIVSNIPSAVGIQAQGGNANAAGPIGTFGTAGSATNVIAITNNRIAGASAAVKMGAEAIVALVNGRGQGNFNISGNGTVANPVTNMAGQAISHSAFGLANVTSTISNNVIVANNTVASPGIGVGTGVTFSSADTPQLTVTISGNSISNSDGNGILAVARAATATLRVKIQNNTVGAPLSGVRPGIRVDAGNSSSANDTVCANISGNTSAGSGGTQGIGLRRQGTAPGTSVFGVNAMAATGTPGVEAYMNTLNPAGSGTLLISATTGFTNCSLP